MCHIDAFHHKLYIFMNSIKSWNHLTFKVIFILLTAYRVFHAVLPAAMPTSFRPAGPSLRFLRNLNMKYDRQSSKQLLWDHWSETEILW